MKVGSLECVCLSLLAATPILLVSLEMVRLVGGWDARWLDQTNASPSNPHRRRDPRHRPSLPITPSDPCSEDILLESRARTCISCGLFDAVQPLSLLLRRGSPRCRCDAMLELGLSRGRATKRRHEYEVFCSEMNAFSSYSDAGRFCFNSEYCASTACSWIDKEPSCASTSLPILASIIVKIISPSPTESMWQTMPRNSYFSPSRLMPRSHVFRNQLPSRDLGDYSGSAARCQHRRG